MLIQLTQAVEDVAAQSGRSVALPYNNHAKPFSTSWLWARFRVAFANLRRGTTLMMVHRSRQSVTIIRTDLHIDGTFDIAAVRVCKQKNRYT